MFNPLLHPLTLRGLSMIAMAKAFLRYRNPRRRAIGRHHTAFYERAWREAAAQLGATCKSLGSGIVEIELDGVRTRVVENTSGIDDPVTLAVLSDKLITYNILREESLPVPRHAAFSLKDLSAALDFLESSRVDCVVKPASGTGGGRGVTTGIRTRWQLGRAAAVAAVYCDELIIEEQIAGDNYRLLYLDGELIDAFVRRHPSIVGDGRSSVARLVRDVNDDRSRHGAGKSQVLLTTDLDMRRTLAKQGLTLRSVPQAGKSVILKTVVNENAGADNSSAARLLCPSIVEDGARAVRALRVRLAGVDIITTDPAVPLTESGGVMLEVNAPPNYYYHYQKQDGPFPVANHVLKRLLVDAAVQDRAFAPAGALS
ncbi:MAG: cphA [Phycisphaerales bacterium]|nr:cphA [Phycisphaerales bacterium]